MNENGKLFLVGDSRVSQVFGVGADPRNLVGHRISEICPINVQTYASSGQRMSRYPSYEFYEVSFVDHFHDVLYPHGVFGQIDVIAIMLGYNDWVAGDSASLSKYIESYREVIRYLKEIQIVSIVVISDIYTIDDELTQNSGGFYLQDFRDAAEAVATEFSIYFIDGKTLIPQNSANYDGGVHPNNTGHALFGANIVDAMQTLGIFPADY